MKKMSLTDFRKDIYKVTNEMEKGEKIQLTKLNIVVLEIRKKV